MENPNIKTKVVHSESKDAWNVVGVSLAKKYKIARVPYLVIKDLEDTNKSRKEEARLHAEFISYCFNNSEVIYNQKP